MPETTRPTKEVDEAIWRSLCHDRRCTPYSIGLITGKRLETMPPLPTETERELARPHVEKMLSRYYNTFNADYVFYGLMTV
mgnify:CR=1 FL=1